MTAMVGARPRVRHDIMEDGRCGSHGPWFAGIKGESTYRGERLGGLRTGDYVYVDTIGSCTVP